MNGHLNLEALWRFLAAGLAGGTGLVAVYALGLLGLSSAVERGRPGARRPLGLLTAGVCFLTVAAGIGAGLYALSR